MDQDGENSIEFIQNSLNEIIQDIENNVFDNDEQIEKELKELLEKFDEDRRVQYVNDLHQKFQGRSFLNLTYFNIISTPNHNHEQPEEDLVQIYNEALKEQQFDLIIQRITNPEFCQKNQIPVTIKDHKKTLEKLGQNVGLIFDLIEQQKSTIRYSYMKSLELLLKIFYLNDEIHQFVGSCLELQLYEFELYVDNFKEKDNDAYQQVIKNLQLIQQKDKMKEELDQILSQNTQNLDLFDLLSIEIDDYHQKLLEYIKNYPNIEYNNQDKTKIIRFFNMTENFSNLVDILYFKLVIYFWIKHSEKFELQKFLNDMYEYKLKKAANKRKCMERGLESLAKEQKDFIFKYLIHKIVFFSNFKDDNFNENYSKYKQQFNIQTQLNNHQYLSQIWNDIGQLKFYQLEQLYGSKNQEILFFLFVSTTAYTEQMILELNLIFQHKVDLFEIKNELFKKINLQGDNILQENLLHLKFMLRYMNENSQNNPLSISKWISQINLIEKYPQSLQIKLNEFNLTLIQENPEISKQIINDWLSDRKDHKKFKNLIPFYFNIIKRGEPSQHLLDLINQDRKFDHLDSLNMKSLFQILYNNADSELQAILIKLHSKNNSIPLIYKHPQIQNATKDLDLFRLNENIYYLLEQDFTIINFSLTQIQEKIGKTYLINKLFYKDDKFEICDSSLINKNTIDCTFDFAFNRSRNFFIADAHGSFQDELFQLILPLFKCWIIQMRSEQELKENIDRVNNILSLLDCKPMICFVIRDSKKLEIKMEQINQIKASKIKICQIENLQQMDNQPQQGEIAKIRNTILEMIGKENELVKEQDLKKSFLQVCTNFEINTFKILQIQELIDNLEIELNIIKSNPEGFYNENAFPLRFLEWKIEALHMQRSECDKEIKSNQQNLQDKQRSINYLRQLSECQDEMNKTNLINGIEAKLKEMDEININLDQLKKQQYQIIECILQFESQQRGLTVQTSNLLSIFSFLFKLDNYYIGYLMTVDKIAKFNNILQIENDASIKKVQENAKLNGNKKEETDQQIKILQNNQKLQNVSIELFWREIINGYPHFDLDYIDIIVQLLQRGEPFEFLNGDDLTINFKFLKQLGQKLITHKEQNKILIISILGPQSSGKSTLLNKMFGCHFLTSVGRCTKGMYLQLLKISNKEQFDNLYDYILLLDSEGLQNPNQQDQVFDKRLALFIVSISDIIIFNVKGEINSQFHNLIEMCLFTLVEHQKLSSNIQFIWCFNQNSQTSDKKKLHNQIEDIVEKLKEEKKWQRDVYEISGFREEDIEILGMASVPDKWNNLSCSTHSKEWTQERIIEVYSKDAYSMGINLILRYIRRGKTFIKEMQQFITWEHFTKKFEECWQIISRFPDVVEFVELKQQKDYERLNKILNEIIKKRDKQFSEQVSSLIYDIQYEIKKQQNLSTTNLQNIKISIEDNFKGSTNQIKEDIFSELSLQTYDVSKKILEKVKDHAQELISSHLVEGTLVIQQEISKYQIQLQYQLIEEKVNKALKEILNDEQKLNRYKTDKESRENYFKQFWMDIIHKSSDQIESIYDQFQEQLIESICLFSKSYIYNLDQKDQIKYIFSQKINKSNPDNGEEIYRERLSYQLFQEEFEKYSFVYLNKDSPIDYLNIFSNPIKQRFENISKDCIINPKEYIEINNIQQIIEKPKFISHLQNKFEHFTKQLLLIKEKDQFEQIILNFIHFVKELQINFDQNLYQSLEDMLKSRPNQCNYLIEAQIFKLLKNIVQTFKLSSLNMKCLQFQNYNLKFFREYFPDFIEQSEKVSNQLQEDLNNYFIISEKCEYKNKLDPGSRYYNFIEFIISKETKLMDEHTFRKEFPDEFINIMKKSGGWDRLSWGIYQLIKKEIMSQNIHTDSTIASSISKEEDMTQINFQLISRIMRKVKDLLNQYNKQFAFFGLQISQLLERKLYYYSIFLIWRFICYKKWAIQDQEKQTLDLKLKEMKEFFDDIILQNHKEVCIRNGKLLAQCIYQNLINQQYRKIQPNTQQYLMKQSKTSQEIIQMLDQKLLLCQERINSMKQDLDEQIMSYVYRQKEFIEQYVYLEIQKFKDEIMTIFENECSINEILDAILKNSLELQQQFKNSSENKDQNQLDYFGYNNLDQETEEIIQAIFNFKLGEQAENLNYFQNSDIIDNQSIKRFGIPGVKNLSYKVDAFLGSFIMEIEALKIQKVQPQIEKFNVQNILDSLQNDMIGCDQSCPMCNRKCDSPDYKIDNHKHKCLNGHQQRGMNRVLINSYPSPYTCEEIIDEAEIKIFETNRLKSWSEVKKIHNDWIFKELESQKLVDENIQKMMQIWNGGVGELISKDLQSQFQQEIVFSQKHDISMNQQNNSFHYIFILDNSTSMHQHWLQVKICMAEQFEQIKQKKNAKVSVILFGATAKIVINCQAVDIDKQIELIQYEGSWFTLFGPALSAARELVLQHSEFTQTVILFYTDGKPSRFINYQQNDEVDIFCNIEKRFRDSIYFFACSQPNLSSSLERIIDRFSQAFAQAALRDSIEPFQLNHIWTEIISKNYHRCLA
ncbi:unnamed protein product (macronuclear) [Paramecium tetraurelia]|uniref:VLIG-type G domain-containing protein n=1 Tax=Paramecium tetraurelia TaxID=5888 RepID=A0BI06_PARTE|nr:uncharacterized protein GSPATT00029209001 [Paramecium tetraurelia]CAK58173.1 unnamed protein product [Paramecium tetraurelia]|eukprot:XP_001425571.1 hypothetical protein (macronuclear) [Paramecium tetraurelia strain d4-2]